MKIHVVPFAKAVKKNEIKDKAVIVIDVLRATSVMITALHNGAKEIIPSPSIKESYKLSKNFNSVNILLCGERDAKKIEGFDLGNSPLEFTPGKVKGKTIIQTTTNGTKALHACQKANQILVAAFLNVNAVVQKVKDFNELHLVCSGTNGKFSLDDGICAALIVEKLSKIAPVKTDDLGKALLTNWLSSNGDLNSLLNDCFHANYLKSKGYGEDVNYCFELNTHNIVPIYKEGKITVV